MSAGCSASKMNSALLSRPRGSIGWLHLGALGKFGYMRASGSYIRLKSKLKKSLNLCQANRPVHMRTSKGSMRVQTLIGSPSQPLAATPANNYPPMPPLTGWIKPVGLQWCKVTKVVFFQGKWVQKVVSGFISMVRIPVTV